MHIPVLLKEMLEFVSPQDGETIVDATFGFGGYTRAILEQANIKVIALDRDENVIPTALKFSQEFRKRFEFYHTTFGKIDEVLKGQQVEKIVADFGVSSMQLDTEERGFSFLKPAKLDMRMGLGCEFSAFMVVNTFPEPQLVEIIRKYGEERLAKKIANFIIQARAKKPIETTLELANLIEKAYGSEARYTKIHPATKTFQAIRIFINNELAEIEELLEKSKTLLKPNGRLVCISFHSLEDSLVKDFANQNSKPKVKVNKYAQFSNKEIIEDEKPFSILTKEAIFASPEEVANNVRSRSARLRALLKN